MIALKASEFNGFISDKVHLDLKELPENINFQVAFFH